MESPARREGKAAASHPVFSLRRPRLGADRTPRTKSAQLFSSCDRRQHSAQHSAQLSSTPALKPSGAVLEAPRFSRCIVLASALTPCPSRSDVASAFAERFLGTLRAYHSFPFGNEKTIAVFQFPIRAHEKDQPSLLCSTSVKCMRVSLFFSRPCSCSLDGRRYSETACKYAVGMSCCLLGDIT